MCEKSDYVMSYGCMRSYFIVNFYGIKVKLKNYIAGYDYIFKLINSNFFVYLLTTRDKWISTCIMVLLPIAPVKKYRNTGIG